MKAFVSSSVCLACDGCCHCPDQGSDWRAKVTPAEETVMRRDILEVSGVDFMDGHYLKDKPCQSGFACVFFNTDDHTCRVYHARPLECRLYPFVLTVHQGRPAVSVHRSCPYVQSETGQASFHEYVVYLKEYFRQESVVEELRTNSFLFGEYALSRDELEFVFYLDEVGLNFD
jgi:Fe-S-cluster containining protein